MDTVITDWLVHSPQRATDAGEDLACVDQWLNSGLIDLGTDLGEDDIARSLEEFTGREFFNDSPPPCAGREDEHAPLQHLSASSQPTSSGDGSTSSDVARGDASSMGMGHFSRGGGFRSFSVNDLQLLLEQQEANLLPPVVGLSAPPQFGGHMGLAGAKARTRPVLESVPEGAPSPGDPLPGPHATMAIPASSVLLPGGDDCGIGAASPAPGMFPGAGSVVYLPRSPPDPVASAAYHAPAADGSAAAPEALADAASTQLAGPLALEAGCGTMFGASSSGGLRHVPSTGTLSALMSNTLSFQREGTDESTQQQQMQQAPTQRAQQGMGQFSEGAMAAAGVAGAAAPHGPAPAGAPASAGYGLAAAAAVAAAAAAAGMFPLGTVPGLAQPFALPPSMGLYGMPPHMYSSATAFQPGAYALGLPLQSAHMLPRKAVGADDPAAAVGCGGGEAAAANAAGGLPRLRKSQSALELGAWRSASFELPADAAEAAAELAAGQKLIGRLTPEERLQRILRYRHKRNMRNFNREIKYQCRKTLADTRPRVGGRFARNNDPNSVLPHQSKKALRAKQGPAAMVVDSAGGFESKAGAAAAKAAAADARQQLQQYLARIGRPPQPAVSMPATSSSTTSSTGSGNQATICASSGTAAASVASGGVPPYAAKPLALPAATPGRLPPPPPLGPATAPHPHAASIFATACGLPYSYGMPGMPYTTHGMVPGGLQQLTSGALPHAVDAAALLNHNAVVNAAAQAVARGMYAHLGFSAAASPTPLHALGLTTSPFGTGAVPPPPAAQAAGAASGGIAVGAASAPLTIEGAGAGAPLAFGAGSVEVPPGSDSSLVDALWTHLVAQAAADARPPAQGSMGAPPVGGWSCMAVDG